MQFDITGLVAGERNYHDIVQDTQAAGATGLNYLPYSEDFSEWNDWSSLAALSTGQADPLGGNSATTITDVGSGTGWAYLTTAGISLAVQQWCFSVYAKANPSDMGLSAANWITGANMSYVDLGNGQTLTKDTDHSAHGVTELGDGWYRYYIVFTNEDTGNGNGQINITDGTTNWLTRNGSYSITIFGAQLNPGTTPDPYTQTTGTPVTS